MFSFQKSTKEVRLFHGPEAASADIRVLADSIICCMDTGLPAIDSLHQQAASFLAAIITYLFAVSDYVHGIPAMSDILKFISDKNVAEVVALLQSSFPSDNCLPEVSTFLDLNEMPSDDVIQIMKEVLKPYSIPAVDFHTKTSSFHFSDFIMSEAPLSESKTPLSVYYCLDGQWDYRGIASLFVNMLFYKLSLSSITKEHQSKCLVMLDDSIELSYLPLVESAFVTSAAHGVRICLMMQNNKQLEGIFGRENQIAQHCGVHVYFRTDPFRGESTLAAIPNLSVGKVITPEELLRLDLDKVIVFIEGHRPILAHKLRYYNNPCLKKICGEGEE
ncbi:MAG: type IV secretory system conjugative DNA transfer family protein [Schwartzia sp.]|nr:type IV secretory system conjugative DNA transfer family protein [Schwartzia sp. (in: firmicutes)]